MSVLPSQFVSPSPSPLCPHVAGSLVNLWCLRFCVWDSHLFPSLQLEAAVCGQGRATLEVAVQVWFPPTSPHPPHNLPAHNTQHCLLKLCIADSSPALHRLVSQLPFPGRWHLPLSALPFGPSIALHKESDTTGWLRYNNKRQSLPERERTIKLLSNNSLLYQQTGSLFSSFSLSGNKGRNAKTIFFVYVDLNPSSATTISWP